MACTNLESIIRVLYSVLTTHSLVSFHHHIFGPLYSPHPPLTPLPLWSPPYCFQCFWVVFCVFVAFCFISHIWVKSYHEFFCLTYFGSLILPRFIHIDANGNISSFLMAESYCKYHIFVIQSSIEGHVGCIYTNYILWVLQRSCVVVRDSCSTCF